MAFDEQTRPMIKDTVSAFAHITQKRVRAASDFAEWGIGCLSQRACFVSIVLDLRGTVCPLSQYIPGS